VYVYTGNYSEYLEQKQLEREQQRQAHEQFMKEMGRLEQAAQEKMKVNAPDATINRTLSICSIPNETLTEKASILTANAMMKGETCFAEEPGASLCNNICIPINPSITPDNILLHTVNICADNSPAMNPRNGKAILRNDVHSANLSLPLSTCRNE